MQQISVTELRARMYGPDRGELALLDVRELGQIASGHILFTVPLPYSEFELRLAGLVPRFSAPVVLVDAGDGVADRAAARAEAMGYGDVAVLAGGVAAWAEAGFELFDGVNVPSKVFGELVEHASHTPRLTAAEVAARQAAGADMVIVDGRPLYEYRKMNIPGATSCPNGELALRIDSLAPDPETVVVVNCAGRTRSIIGAQTLIDAGVPNPVFALENGTQGWTLAGLTLEHGNDSALAPEGPGVDARRAVAMAHAAKHGVEVVSRDAMAEWLGDASRTVYLFDVRDTVDREADPVAVQELRAAHHVVHAPGGQLVQATDRWVAVRGARIVLLDTEGLRAPMVAAWLAQLGHHAAVVEGGLAALAGVAPRDVPSAPALPSVPALSAEDLGQATASVLDLRPSAAYREAHIEGATWSSRARLVAGEGLHVLVADTGAEAALVAVDLAAAGVTEIARLTGSPSEWEAAGVAVVATPQSPPDAERIDFIFHTHDRHQGNLDASRAYLEWEVGLIARLHADERAVFRI